MKANISGWAIRNPMPSVLLFIVLTLLGLVSFQRLPITYFPTIDIPIVSITIAAPGMQPAQMETEVTRAVEDAVASLTGIEQLSSTVGEGRSSTSVEFDLSVPIDRAMSDVRDAVSEIRSDLPVLITEPVFERVEAESQAVVTYAVSAPGMSHEEASWFVDDVVVRNLQGFAGVGRIQRIGGVEREVQIRLDPDRLLALNTNVSEVNEQLAATQLNASGGRSVLDGRERAVTTFATARSVAELARMEIVLSNGNSVALGDLGKVEDTVLEPRSFAAMNGADVVSFAVFRAPSASDTSVADNVSAALAALGDVHSDVRFEKIDDSVTYTMGNYSSAMTTLVEGAVLAIIVVFLFLRDWRATLMAAMALPLSAIPTFWVIDLLGFSLNILSLLGITLVTGILVDDAIVEIENVARHRQMGKSPYRAALDASDEIGLAVVAISATIIAVFAPVGLMSGVVGQYFRQFGLTVAIAVFFSLLVARLITPIMAAYFLREPSKANARQGRFMAGFLRALRVTIVWRWATLAATLLLFAGSIWSMQFLSTGFLPEEDMGKITISAESPSGSTLADTRRSADDIAKRIGEIDGVASVFVRGGTSPTGLEEIRRAAILVSLVPKAERDRSAAEIEPLIAEALSAVPDTRFEFLNERGGRDMSFSVLSTDGEAADTAARAILAEMTSNADFVGPASSSAILRPELQVTVLHERAADLGVSAEAIAQAVRVSTIGDVDDNLATFLDAGRQIPIRLQLTDDGRDDLETLRGLRVPSLAGAGVPLAAVADVGFGESVATIERSDRERRIGIGADVAAGLTPGDGLARIHALQSVASLPDHVRIEAAGDSDAQANVFTGFAFAMGSGIILVLVVLVLLFGSVFAPFTILAALPLSIGGVVVALQLTGTAVSLPVVIGILMLMGIVTKNAIMLVDFAMVRERAGVSRQDAVVEAASERARPIVMTTLAMVAGMVPVALGVGDGGEFRAPMAIAVIGGLIASTLLSLIVVPSLHVLMSDFGDRAGRISRNILHPNRRDGSIAPNGDDGLASTA